MAEEGEEIQPMVGAVAFCLLWPGIIYAQPDDCPKGGGAIGFQLENDLSIVPFLPGSDEAYTNGARIDYGGHELGAKTKRSLRTFPFKADAAFLYGAYQTTKYRIREHDVNQADTFELALGVLGPGAGGRWFQDTAHDLNNIKSEIGQEYKRPLGWHHQLRNEVGIMARLLRQRREAGDPAHVANRRWDLLSHAGGSAGNVFTWGLGGAIVRYGWNVPNDLGPQQKLPSIFIVPRRPVASDRGGTRAQEEQETPDWSVYVFGGGEGRFVIGKGL